jgi:hypothetical protein
VLSRVVTCCVGFSAKGRTGSIDLTETDPCKVRGLAVTPRGGLSEIRSGVLIRLREPSASCASQADLERGILKIASQLGIGTSVVQRIVSAD